MSEWKSIASAPKDGSMIEAKHSTRDKIYRVAWGVTSKGHGDFWVDGMVGELDPRPDLWRSIALETSNLKWAEIAVDEFIRKWHHEGYTPCLPDKTDSRVHSVNHRMIPFDFPTPRELAEVAVRAYLREAIPE